MLKKTLTIICLLAICGCNGGDIKITPVIKKQPAPHSGYNLSPEMWVEQGERVPMTGVVLWLKGTEPNDIFE